MSLSLILASMPLWLSGMITVVPSMVACGLLPYLVRRRFKLDTLKANNEVSGFKYATLGVIYAVMLAFVVLVIWEDFRDAGTEAQAEACSALTLYRLSASLPDPHRRQVRATLRQYAQGVAGAEWRSMAKGHASHEARTQIRGLFATYGELGLKTPVAGAGLEVSLQELARLNERRNQRIYRAEESIPGVLWAVLLLGGALVVGFPLFMGSPHVRAQCAMTGLLACMVAMVLFVIAVMDHPYAGQVSVRPDAMEQALASMRAEP